ncbi:MAG TPA: chorismate synthase [Candidatus Sulfomarinibacteraceae bacterium]|nr:chorismate synthase [Candidatus Sulfomarinibacteraceae bacterium]
MLRRLRLLTGGESHGPLLTAVLDGLPAGLPVDRVGIDRWLARRQHGFGRGGRQRIERDAVVVTGGLRDGRTMGGPLVLELENRDWKNWAAVMDPWSADADQAARRAVTRPRPGHADFAGGAGTDQLADMRNVLERASARETGARVMAGAVCAQLLARYDIEQRSAVLRLGPHGVVDGPPSWDGLARVRHDSPLVTPDPDTEEVLVEAVRAAREAGDTLGGVVGAVVRGLPPGLGSHTHWDRKLDGRIAQAVTSIHSVKAAAIGAGLEVAGLPGSEAHDPVRVVDGVLRRDSNRAGGLEGGVTNGEDLVVRAFFKPISTLRQGLPSVDLSTGEPGATAWERSDVTAIGAAPVIVEAMLALVLADELLARLGGDAIADTDAAWRAYCRRLEPWWRPRVELG